MTTWRRMTGDELMPRFACQALKGEELGLCGELATFVRERAGGGIERACADHRVDAPLSAYELGRADERRAIRKELDELLGAGASRESIVARLRVLLHGEGT